jgi:hypothetical protein
MVTVVVMDLREDPMDAVAVAAPATISKDSHWRTQRRLSGLSGLGMLAVIVANGPLRSLRGVPWFWEPDAATRIGERLGDEADFASTLIFFFLSTLIFVFGIPFVAGIRRLVREQDPAGLGADVVLLGGALFFGGGLLSEVFSSGFSIVVNSAPTYALDVNAALGVGALQFAALVQAQVGLGLLMIAASLAIARGVRSPRWLVVIGLTAGGLDLIRPITVANPPLGIVLFLPSFVWMATFSIWLLRTPAGLER